MRGGAGGAGNGVGLAGRVGLVLGDRSVLKLVVTVAQPARTRNATEGLSPSERDPHLGETVTEQGARKATAVHSRAVKALRRVPWGVTVRGVSGARDPPPPQGHPA